MEEKMTGTDNMEGYFKSFESEGNSSESKRNTEIDKLLSDRHGVFLPILRQHFEGKPIKTLVLGSATPRNIPSIQYFLTHGVQAMPEESELYIMDKEPGSLIPHKAYADTDERVPRVHVFGGDVRKHTTPAGYFDIILSDYTTSFLEKETDWKDFFVEIGHSLSTNGLAIVQCFVCRDGDISNILYRDTTHARMSCINGAILPAILDEADLEVEAENYRKSRRVYEGHDSEIAILVLKKRAK